MGVEGSDVDGVPKEVGGVGRPRSGPIRIIAPRRKGPLPGTLILGLNPEG
jgi:hypothetical protein